MANRRNWNNFSYEHANLVHIDNIDNSSIKSHSTSYKTYNERLIACNGDCGSEISKIIDYIFCEKACNESLVYNCPISINEAYIHRMSMIFSINSVKWMAKSKMNFGVQVVQYVIY